MPQHKHPTILPCIFFAADWRSHRAKHGWPSIPSLLCIWRPRKETQIEAARWGPCDGHRYTLPETNSSHLKIGHPKRKLVTSIPTKPSIFRGELLVSGRVHQYLHLYWVMVWNIFLFSTLPGGNDPFWRSYFSDGLKPPTNLVKACSLWKFCFFTFVLSIWKKRCSNQNLNANLYMRVVIFPGVSMIVDPYLPSTKQLFKCWKCSVDSFI